MQQNISDVHLHETTQERYLNYALSVITSRALPDVRDGLKPVQRRILYAMYHNLRLTADAKHKKSAAVVGEVMAKYHPHGDQSIYDALVRMAQDFSLRYPLVDGQGNFGSLDGDGAAAMRYTEAKLQHIAGELLSELKKNTVDRRANYDGTLDEPVALPAQVPNLLINGAAGIAVGMATNIPPHNLTEVVRALIALISEPELPLESLVGNFVRGPDFPTGGEILTSPADMLEMYKTGRGPVEIRGEWTLESEGHRKRIVVTSIPYGVNKSNLVAEIADHVGRGKVPQLVDVRDESTDEMRVVLDLKRGADAEAAMAYLYKRTALQNRFNVNLTALCPVEGSEACSPRRLNLKEILREFLDFRFEVVQRRLAYDLEQLERRIHLLRAFEIIFDALDEAIQLIRASDGKADARQRLMDRFGLDWDQSEAILETKLYRLAKLEIDSIRKELAEKMAEAAAIREVLASERLLWELVREELESIVDAYGDARRTKVTGPVEVRAFTAEHYIVAEDAFVMVTRKGLLKRQKSYSDLSSVRVRDGDEIGWIMPASTLESLILFTDRGRAYTLRVIDVPQTTGYGEPVQTRFDFTDGEHIIGVVVTDPRCLPQHVEPEQPEAHPTKSVQAALEQALHLPVSGVLPLTGLTEAAPVEVEATPVHRAKSDAADDPDGGGGAGDQFDASSEPGADGESAGDADASGDADEETDDGPEPPYAVAVSRGGRCLRMSLQPLRDPSNRNGRIFMRLDRRRPLDAVVRVVMSNGSEIVSLATRQSHYLLFPVGQVNILSGPGKGVMAIKLKGDDYVMGFELTTERMHGLQIETSRGRVEILRPNKYRVSRRGGKGRELMRIGYIARVLAGPEEILLPPREESEGEPGGDAASDEHEGPEPTDVPDATAQVGVRAGDTGDPADSSAQDAPPADPVDVIIGDKDQGDLFGSSDDDDPDDRSEE